MENTKKKKSRLSEFIIVILVVVCAFLVVADITTNLIEELDAQKSIASIESTGISTPKAHPTYLPAHTLSPNNESNFQR